jgi:hypothetical protein
VQSIGTPFTRDELPRRASAVVEDAEPLEEFDGDDIDDDRDRKAPTDDLDSK